MLITTRAFIDCPPLPISSEVGDGIQFYGPGASGSIVRGAVFEYAPDELASVVMGATDILFDHCTFKGDDKGVLLNTGDGHACERGIKATFTNCLFESPRRNPYSHGAFVVMRDCVIRNWRGGYKSYGLRGDMGAVFDLENVRFEQDRFRIEPVNWIRGGGCWKGLVLEDDAVAVLKNVSADRWWIRA